MSGLFRERAALPQTYAGPESFFRQREGVKFVFHEDDPFASIGVGERASAGRLLERSIITNGKSDGGTRVDYPTMALLATVPALLADRMERAFVIGLGTGVTAAELASLADTREVLVAEISPAVVKAAPLFDFANGNASTNPTIEIVRSDAFRALQQDREGFDVIASEPSNPWVAGVEMLFSREFLEAARDRLRPGGVHAQWFHLYETDVETVALILRTYASVFEETAVWYARGNDLLLLGFARGARDAHLDRLRARLDRPDFRASLARSGIDGLPALLAHELVPAGVLAQLRLPGPVHTLAHPRLGHTAARAFFRGRQARLPFTGAGAAARVGRESSLWRRHLRSLGDRAGEETYEQFSKAVCANRSPECIAALAEWHRAFPGSLRLERALGDLGQSALTFGGPLERDALGRYLDALFTPAEGGVSLERARRATLLYQRHYFHAAPPPGAALRELWRRCLATPEEPAGCSQGRAAVAGLLDEDGPRR